MFARFHELGHRRACRRSVDHRLRNFEILAAAIRRDRRQLRHVGSPRRDGNHVDRHTPARDAQEHRGLGRRVRADDGIALGATHHKDHDGVPAIGAVGRYQARRLGFGIVEHVLDRRIDITRVVHAGRNQSSCHVHADIQQRRHTAVGVRRIRQHQRCRDRGHRSALRVYRRPGRFPSARWSRARSTTDSGRTRRTGPVFFSVPHDGVFWRILMRPNRVTLVLSASAWARAIRATSSRVFE